MVAVVMAAPVGSGEDLPTRLPGAPTSTLLHDSPLPGEADAARPERPRRHVDGVEPGDMDGVSTAGPFIGCTVCTQRVGSAAASNRTQITTSDIRRSMWWKYVVSRPPRSTSRVLVSMIAVSPTSAAGQHQLRGDQADLGPVDGRAHAGADDLVQEERLGNGLLGEDHVVPPLRPAGRRAQHRADRLPGHLALGVDVHRDVQRDVLQLAGRRPRGPSSRRASCTGTSAGAAAPAATWGSGGPGRRDGPMRPCRAPGVEAEQAPRSP